MILTSISILNDNYVWILYNTNNFCIIIDPGVSENIIKKIEEKKWKPIAILLTHNHIDHTGGVREIVKRYPNIIVFGPEETKKNGVNQVVQKGDTIKLLESEIDVFFTPGHTLGHVSYYLKPYIFCGDTLFSGGCGRVFENRFFDMYQSINFIKSLPKKTILCCSHEYTLSNLIFSMSIIPFDKKIKKYYKKIKKIISKNNKTLPVTLETEKKINIFLRTREDIVKESMGLKSNTSSFEVFILLRKKKDIFNWS
ncbi:hydroxyacylglutathione hydrolase [uncultured Buchnera sp.]|uniref:hydroxyacylglutathione hydrolase n=1 Tax=uncultured Buchnera sp. TaxID=574037 RepID=UPI0025D7973A|nr:hydroxyacylglutathione hydrolase [uncultured Buchnera sp.]